MCVCVCARVCMRGKVCLTYISKENFHIGNGGMSADILLRKLRVDLLVINMRKRK